MQSRRKHESTRSDAIHRSLLAGLLGNIAQKGEGYEYTGARGTKVNIHPGSALFNARPQWIMAAELVETTRLYARTVAKIQPEWVEHLAEHIVKRTYTEPHWNEQTAHVVAYERVTLYGLTLIPQRTVHYGPIDPVMSREIFIRHALVQEEYRTDAPFFRHNRKLIDEIQNLEAKARTRDVLVSHDARFDFYNARIPAGIYNGPLFEQWRRQVERHNPRLLFMTRRDLMQHSASDITQEMFPDQLHIGTMHFPLEYHLEPGHAADGVTVTIPLELLTQVPAERFEWLVPGFLKEKITALIKSLPKNLRVNFVPAPDFAQEAFSTLKPGDGSLRDALAMFLGRKAGMAVPPEAFDPSALLDHLHMNFKIIDANGRQLAQGRDLEAIRKRLGVQVKHTFEQLPHPRYRRENITQWDFGDLPESIVVQRHGMNLTAYPALVDDGKTVSLKLMDSPDSARLAHRAGLRRLFLLQLGDELQYLASSMPGMREMSLQYAPLGPTRQLREDLVARTIDQTFLPDANVRTQMEFELRLEAGRRHRLLETGQKVAELAARLLAAYHAVALELSRPTIPAFAPAIADIREQLAHLMRPGFITETPDCWLAHYPRWLKAIAVRLEKLKTVGHTRDAERQAEVRPFWEAYLDRSRRNREQGLVDANLDLFRWMIEEFRVSLFAQELRTAIPISAKRLEKQWELVKKG